MSHIKPLIEDLGDHAPPLEVEFGDTSKPVDKDLLRTHRTLTPTVTSGTVGSC
jgi:hypothetical protein